MKDKAYELLEILDKKIAKKERELFKLRKDKKELEDFLGFSRDTLGENSDE